MNPSEAAYAERLERLRVAGRIERWKFEAITFKLAKRTTYTPDFMVITNDGFMEFHETKGRWGGLHQHSRVKIKVAAKMFPEFLFLGIMVKKKTKKAGGGYEFSEPEEFSA